MKKFTTVSLPKNLFKLIKERIKGTVFSSPSEYVTYKMRQILIEECKNSSNKKLFERLKKMGYV